MHSSSSETGFVTFAPGAESSSMEVTFTHSSGIVSFDEDNSAQGRQIFYIFAVSLCLAVAFALLLLLNSSPAEALPLSNAVQAKADAGVALAALGSVAISAIVGAALIRTQLRQPFRLRRR